MVILVANHLIFCYTLLLERWFYGRDLDWLKLPRPE